MLFCGKSLLLFFQNSTKTSYKWQFNALCGKHAIRRAPNKSHYLEHIHLIKFTSLSLLIFNTTTKLSVPTKRERSSSGSFIGLFITDKVRQHLKRCRFEGHVGEDFHGGRIADADGIGFFWSENNGLNCAENEYKINALLHRCHCFNW